MILQLIKAAFRQLVDDIDSGNSNINEQEQKELLDLIERFTTQKLSKLESADYIGVSRATFDNYIDRGSIPKGEKRRGTNTLFWKKSDLNKYLNSK